MFRIKICGVTNLADALAAAQAGAEAIGLNFAAGSPRAISPQVAKTLAAAIPTTVEKVGVFVDLPPDEIIRLAREVPLSHVQFHGQPDPALLTRLPNHPVIQAFRLSGDSLSPIADFLGRSIDLGVWPAAVLIDAHVPGQAGGTGVVADWSLAARYHALAAEFDELPPLILAGGLRPENVAAGIRAVRPWGVDTASGVERSPGVKDADQMAAFVAAAREALGIA